MKRADLVAGGRYAYNRGPSSYNTPREVELLSTEDHWRQGGELVPIPEGRHRDRRGTATLPVIRIEPDAEHPPTPFLCAARELVAHWADEADRQAQEAKDRAAAAERRRQVRAAMAPATNAIADRLVGAGIALGEDNHTVRQLRTGEPNVEIKMSVTLAARLLGIALEPEAAPS